MQLVAWALQWVACYVLLEALGLDLDMGAAAAVLFAVNVTAVLPLTPSNLGVFQAACLAVLTAGYGVDAAQALGYGIILQAVEIATAVVMGAPALVKEGLSWREVRLRALHTAPVSLGPARARGRGLSERGEGQQSSGLLGRRSPNPTRGRVATRRRPGTGSRSVEPRNRPTARCRWGVRPPGLGVPRWAPEGAQPLPPVRRARLPLVAADGHRAALKGLEDELGVSYLHPYRDERGWRFTGGAFATPSTPSSSSPRRTRRPSRATTAASACRCCGTSRPARSSPTSRPTSCACSTTGAPGRRPLPGAAARGDRRAQRLDLRRTSRTASTAPASRARRRPTTSAFARRLRRDGAAGGAASGAPLPRRRRDHARRLAAFPTLVRFDTVYHTHFRCNGRRIVDNPNLWGYTRELYQRPGIAATVAMDADPRALLHDARHAEPEADHPARAARPRLQCAARSTLTSPWPRAALNGPGRPRW